MQPPQRGGWHLLRPKQQCPAGAGPKDLLGRPECVGHFGRTHLNQLFERHLQIREGRPVGNMRGLHERKGTPTLCRKRWPQ